MWKRLFDSEGRDFSVRTETLAGLTTFLTAAYIIFVNPSILAETGMDKAALVTVTCLTAGLATLAMALWPKVPLMIAPGMGMNGFFTYGVCQGLGIPWPTALGIVFLSGVASFTLAVVGTRQKVFDAIPRTLRLATAVGIGLLIALIGFKQLGVVVPSEATLVKLGTFHVGTVLGLLGFLVMAALEVRRIPGGILIGILVTAFLGFLLGKVTLPEGGVLSWPASMAPTLFKLDIMSALKLALVPTIFSFMFVDLFDSLGTFMALGQRAGMTDEKGRIPKMGTLLKIDCSATALGALFGTTTLQTFVESSTGIAQGGRTGFTAVVVAGLFLVSMFFAPLVMVVPVFATAPALITVGIYMIRDIRLVDFEDWTEAVPAFLTMLLMPLTFSVTNGILFGFLSYTVLKLVAGKARELNAPVWIVSVLAVLYLWVNT
jgi:adenine/guanine/hypoxanthine permease